MWAPFFPIRFLKRWFDDKPLEQINSDHIINNYLRSLQVKQYFVPKIETIFVFPKQLLFLNVDDGIIFNVPTIFHINEIIVRDNNSDH